MQFQADILGVPVVRPLVTETTALGAAYLAGLEAGLIKPEDISTQWQLERRFEPRMNDKQRSGLYGGWQRAVERARHWIEAET
jgi:glycerol kinase